MKTVEEFIQRLQNDPEFERQAQALGTSDEFMIFVKNAGYDFTLDQLLDKFKDDEEEDQPVMPLPAPAKTVEEFIQRLEDDPEFELQAHAFENDADFMEFVQNEGYDFTLEQLQEAFKQSKDTEAERPTTPLKGATTPTTRLPKGGEFMQPADPALRGAETQKPPGGRFSKSEGIGGGRRRGIK